MCNLKRTWHSCQKPHLTILHDANMMGESIVYAVRETPLYQDQLFRISCLVFLKVVPYEYHQGLHQPNRNNATPLILIGCDHSELMLPREPFRFGTTSAPVAVSTTLRKSLQGPYITVREYKMNSTCLLTVKPNPRPLMMESVERLLKVDILLVLRGRRPIRSLTNLQMSLLSQNTGLCLTVPMNAEDDLNQLFPRTTLV